MSGIFEANGRYMAVGRAQLLGGDWERAWAEDHVRPDDFTGWMLGNFVEADQPNQNGQTFHHKELSERIPGLVHKPLNMLHRQNHIVGAFAGAELVGDDGEKAADGTRVEALSAIWKMLFPEEYEAIQKAHAEGTLFYSMEAMPKTLTCSAEGCGLEFAYKGPAHASYCKHLQVPVAARYLNEPTFLGGAVIIPPVRPGWKNANISDIAKWLESDEGLAMAAAFDDGQSDTDCLAWEEFMADIAAQFLEGENANA